MSGVLFSKPSSPDLPAPAPMSDAAGEEARRRMEEARRREAERRRRAQGVNIRTSPLGDSSRVAVRRTTLG
ncbi:hypothetical protein GGQ74_002196 [Desulfobaculum xiamenense]|uniref:Uncharacterized protein n=1 Tax=Desulfobaculum xiamenense TaxID=995050 RepID=A0A846QQA7_9BACT|nr:hypothetical protein [Desulfobaculum xiamenense]NJB68523.1 hypothetical protein [Desulfobaculum xiamenense]